MADEPKDGDLLGDLGKAFDDLYDEAQQGLKQAEDELKKLSRTSDATRSSTETETPGPAGAAARASKTAQADAAAARRAPMTGADRQRHQDSRVTENFDPTTEREFNTDAEDLQILQGQAKQLPPGGREIFDRNVAAKGIKDTYRRLGRNAANNPEWRVRVPRTSDPRFENEIGQLQDEFYAGFDEVAGPPEPEPEPPAAEGPHAPGPSAPSKTAPRQKPLTGTPLAAHRELRATDDYDPTLEREFVTDAADLQRYEWARNTAPENTRENVVARDGAKGILDTYRRLGRRAKNDPNVRVRVPRTHDPRLEQAVGKLRQAFDEGRNEP
jgi:hypothetical protein